MYSIKVRPVYHATSHRANGEQTLCYTLDTTRCTPPYAAIVGLRRYLCLLLCCFDPNFDSNFNLRTYSITKPRWRRSVSRGFVGRARGCDQEGKEGAVRLLGAVWRWVHNSLQGKAIATILNSLLSLNFPLATLSGYEDHVSRPGAL